MIDSGKEFKKLILASFVSQVGFHFLTLALAAYTLQLTGSAVNASLVFVFSYLPAAIAGRWIGPIVDKRTSKLFLCSADGASALISLICGLSIMSEWPVAVFAAILSMRSILNMAQRSAVMKWIKALSKPEIQAARFQTFLLIFFVSTGISGAGAALALSELGIFGTVILNVVTCLIAICFFSLLSPIEAASAAPLTSKSDTSIVSILRTRPILIRAFATVLFSQAIFQGAYSAFVTYLPQRKLLLGTSGVGYYQLGASIGIIVGWAICRRFPKLVFDKHVVPTSFIFFLLATTLSLFGTFSIPTAWLSIVFFFLLNVGFEVLWLAGSSVSFATVPSEATGRFQYAQGSFASVLMSITAVVYALGADKGQLMIAATLVVAVGLFILSGAFLGSRSSGDST